jgi:hypothetical protein
MSMLLSASNEIHLDAQAKVVRMFEASTPWDG